MIDISPGLIKTLLAANLNIKEYVSNTAITFGDGDGAGGLDTINAAAGLDIFQRHSHVHILTPKGDLNRNLLVKVLSSSATKLEVPAGSLTALVASSDVVLQWFDIAGCVRSIFQNCTIRLFNESRASSIADAEPGVSICDITLNGAAFTPGNPLNGLNFGELDGNYLRRSIDPETLASEVMRGAPKSTNTANSFICYANDAVTGASVNSVRFSGTVTGPSGAGDLILANGNQLTLGVNVDVTSIRFVIKAAVFS